jgi:hypothetical protein
MKLKIIIFTLLIFVFNSCSFFDSFDEEPMYLSFAEDPTLVVSADQGENTNGIFGVSVYADGFNIGVFNLPADVPVIDANTETDFNVFAVVRNNGQGDNPIEYPFYEPLEFSQPFVPGGSVTVGPDFKYKEGLNFLYLEDFEGQHRITENIDGSDTVVIEKFNDPRSGQFSGAITTSEDNPFFEKATLNTFISADINNTFAYLELDYKNEIPFRVGIIGIVGNQAQRVYKIQLNTSDDWNKLYLDLTPEILTNNYTSYKLLISNLPGDTDYGTVQFDNIKLITF